MITLESKTGPNITIDHTSYHYFAGNNYLGLASNPELINKAIDALIHYGTNFSASRQTTGTADIHLELETKLARFKVKQAAVVFASGYMGNKLLMDYLKSECPVVLTDAMAHSSIIDGIPRDIETIDTYKHLDTVHLESLLKKYAGKRALIASDGLFALTGEIAPLDKIHRLAEKYDALILIDDAHATGILGKNGRGTPEHFELADSPRIYQAETMSKAIGSYGGFIAGSTEMIQIIRGKSAFYGASTSLPPALVASGSAALDYIKEHPELQQQLLANIRYLKIGIKQLELKTSTAETPIIPIFFNKKADAQKLSTYLKDHQIIAPAVDYPVKTDQYIVRLTVSAAHTQDQVKYLISTLKTWTEDYGRN
ncbi:aminotransferase class I/II-fold pyridoxal phosphate-dependent enzyme [Mangrovibacterium lignilyticum]|uniref:aminotransferase class I/II-fold pyridoxal phosphate-dependent enzyme n=1 Tax=Mangrovibacterium lignilyticum TaxID=2668052 RepID=UPI0013D69604|nr:pyridoxal phosphate-dependent aminotransferase family protein [Mangrovibacterium lignilyticum]